MSTISQQFVYDFIYAKAVDQITSTPSLAAYMLSNSKTFSRNTEKINMRNEQVDNLRYFEGLEPKTSKTVSAPLLASFSFKNIRTEPGFAVSLAEAARNHEEGRVIDLMAYTAEDALVSFTQNLNNEMYVGDGVTKMYGLDAIISDTGSIGGLDRATFPELKAQVINAAGPLSLDLLEEIRRRTDFGGKRATVCFTSKTGMSYLRALVTPFIQYQQQVSGKGVDAIDMFVNKISYAGIEFMEDPSMPDNATLGTRYYFVDKESVAFHGKELSAENRKEFGIEPVVSTESLKTIEGTGVEATKLLVAGKGFYKSAWMRQESQDAIVGNLYLFGNMIAKSSRTSGMIYGVTA